MERPRIWVLLGKRRGDNKQALALAEALGLPFEAKPLRYNALRLLDKRLLGATLAVLEPQSRRQVAGEPPDLVIAVGHRSVPVVRALKRRSGGRMRAVHLGNPRVAPGHFDLVVTTPQYPVRQAPNVLCNPVTLGAPEAMRDGPEPQIARPLRLLLLGGPTIFWQPDEEAVKDSLTRLADKARVEGGSVVAIGSPRTPAALVSRLKRFAARLEPPPHFVPSEGPPSYSDLLGAAEQLFVTADSVAMISEALATGKPVGLVAVRATVGGRLWMAALDRLRPGQPVFPRDLRRFWRELERRKLAGTVDQPRRAVMPDVLDDTRRRVRALIGLAPDA